MANNNRIKILRGTADTIAKSSQKLAPGQPLYNVDRNYLTIGNSSGTTKVNALPIRTNELFGYYDESDQITSISHPEWWYRIYGMENADDLGTYNDHTPGLAILSWNRIDLKLSSNNYPTGRTMLKLFDHDGSQQFYIYADTYLPSSYKINGTITDSQNVTNTINNKNISDIFESNGTTVKNATYATTAGNVSGMLKVTGFDSGVLYLTSTT